MSYTVNYNLTIFQNFASEMNKSLNMIVFFKYLIITITLQTSYLFNKTEQVQSSSQDLSLAYSAKDSSKDKAFSVLETKCNICHKTRNKRRLFTKLNMDNWAEDVYMQVFIIKRMPKGKKIKLTNEDYQQILTWITSLKN